MRLGVRNQLIFGVFAAVVVCTLAFISALMLSLESNEAESRQDAQLQEAVRVTMARMESRLSPILSTETARPYFHYAAFYAADEVYTRMLRPLDVGDILVPSPLLSNTPEFCRLHFQIGADGSFTSPRVPSGNLLDVAEMSYISGADVQKAEKELEALSGSIAGAQFVITMCGEPDGTINPTTGSWRTAETGIEVGTMTAQWIGEDESTMLVVVRTVSTPSSKFVQGVWLDWDLLRSELLKEASGLLTAARLEQSSLTTLNSNISGGPNHALSSLPVMLVPGAITPARNSVLTPTRAMLGVAWITVLVSIVAVGFVVRTLADLGERRGRFVSAVTHELRTPLTTFRLYSHMLADGTVKDDVQRQELVETLSTESDRLQRVVENVLSYARLADVAGKPPKQRVNTHALLTDILPVLERCAAEQDMQLECELEDMKDTHIYTEPQSLERVLVNLVDNACRHAGGVSATTDRRIHIIGDRFGASLHIKVADHGPGVNPAQVSKIFQPFASGCHHKGITSGLGLGLALAREVVREHGGELRCQQQDAYGAVFVITLPIV